MKLRNKRMSFVLRTPFLFDNTLGNQDRKWDFVSLVDYFVDDIVYLERGELGRIVRCRHLLL
jgi:hypothetical protein